MDSSYFYTYWQFRVSCYHDDECVDCRRKLENLGRNLSRCRERPGLGMEPCAVRLQCSLHGITPPRCQLHVCTACGDVKLRPPAAAPSLGRWRPRTLGSHRFLSLRCLIRALIQSEHCDSTVFQEGPGGTSGLNSAGVGPLRSSRAIIFASQKAGAVEQVLGPSRFLLTQTRESPSDLEPSNALSSDQEAHLSLDRKKETTRHNTGPPL